MKTITSVLANFQDGKPYLQVLLEGMEKYDKNMR